MKKLSILLFAAFLMFQTVFADGSYKNEYPVIPEYISGYAKEVLGVDDTGAKFLYEKIVVNEDIITWMVGWFWDDFKIVAGITNYCDIIYYNKASLDGNALPGEGEKVSSQQAYETALDFVKKVNSGRDIRLVNSKAYTYKFAEYKNGIRIFGHDVSVVVDKLGGGVYYYNGFGKYDCSFESVQTLVSKEHALGIYFDKIGMEPVYMLRRDSADRWQSARPVYILNSPETLAVDAQKPAVTEFLMHDYNYYYSDDYVNSFYTPDNIIDFDAGEFIKSEDIFEDEDTAKKLYNLFYSLRSGYTFDYSSGVYSYYDDIEGKNEVPCIAVDIYPKKNLVYGEKIKSLYEAGDFMSLADFSTSLEYIYAKAYVSKSGTLLGFESVISKDYNPVLKSTGDLSSPPRRVDEFIQRAFDKNEDLRLCDVLYENEYRVKYTYGRYKNGIRVIGEGVSITYNAARRDISQCLVNLSSRHFPPIDGIKTSAEMKPFVQAAVDFQIMYVDKGKTEKIPVYQFAEKQVCFDPFTGNRIDYLDFENVTKTFICNVGDNRYNINGHTVTGTAAPLYIGGSFYLPINLFADALGFKTETDGHQIIFSSETDIVLLNTHSAVCTVNGKPLMLENKFIYEADQLYVPLTSAVKIFGLQSWWDETNGKIIIDAG